MQENLNATKEWKSELLYMNTLYSNDDIQHEVENNIYEIHSIYA